MDFEQRPPEWENVGAEPTTEIKKKGFTAGYKPPAAYFNWFWNRAGKCIAEIQGKLETLSKTDVGLGNVDNTKDAEKPISNAVQAVLAGKASNTHTHPVSTTTQDGFMSGADKAKLDKIEPNAGVNIATTTKAGIVKATPDFAVAADGTPTLKITDTKVNVTDTNNHFTATKLDGVLEEIYTKATTTEGRLDNKIGSLSSLQTVNKNNVVAAVNECFTNANNGKSAIAAAIGSPATASNTFAEIANEIKEEKRLVALAAGMNGVETNLREQATTISTYTHSHLPNVITTNGGALVTGSGTAVTPASSTLDTIYHSINNLAGVKNTQINNITGERDTWYNNYVAMETDRNNWMNLANNRKSVQQMYPHPPALQMEKRDFATATINNYAILAGGTRGNIGLGTVDVYTDTLTLTSAQELPDPTAYFAGVSNFGGYALFAGGYRGNVILANQSNAYNSALVRVDVATLSIKRGRLGAAKTQNYALFLGGYVEGKQAVDGYTTALVRFNIANFTGYMPYSNRGKTFGGYALFNGATRMVIAYTDACTQITMAETTSASCEALGTVGGCVLFASLNGTMDVYNANLVKTTTIQQINTRLNVAIELGNNCMFFGGAKAQTSVPRVHGESYTGTLVQTIIPCGALNDTYYIDAGANIGNYGLLFTTASKTVGDKTTYTPVTAGYKIS